MIGAVLWKYKICAGYANFQYHILCFFNICDRGYSNIMYSSQLCRAYSIFKFLNYVVFYSDN